MGTNLAMVGTELMHPFCEIGTNENFAHGSDGHEPQNPKVTASRSQTHRVVFAREKRIENHRRLLSRSFGLVRAHNFSNIDSLKSTDWAYPKLFWGRQVVCLCVCDPPVSMVAIGVLLIPSAAATKQKKHAMEKQPARNQLRYPMGEKKQVGHLFPLMNTSKDM